MKIVDTFLFAETYEAELLLAKLNLEAPLVDCFCLIESDVTFRGDFKGLQARKLIESDPRFAPFRSKIHLIEHRGVLYEGPRQYSSFYMNEELSRSSARQFVFDNFDEDTWIIVSDVDEMFDCTEASRLERFVQLLEENDGRTVRASHVRYWYNWNCLGNYVGIRTPVTQVKTIRSGHTSFMCRSRPDGPLTDYPPSLPPICWEFTFCFFSKENMWAKLSSFLHDQYLPAELDDALATATWVKSAARGERVCKHEDLCELVVLDESNSPSYVRQRFKELDNGLIPKDYRENRRQLYGM